MSFTSPLKPSPSQPSASAIARLTVEDLTGPDAIAQAEHSAAQDVIAGLQGQPKTLPPRYFYDDLGSTLFEQICTLPEYYLTRTETAILTTYSADIAAITGPCDLVELGSGSSTKTRILLNAYAGQAQLKYCPIDVSASILKSSAEALLEDYPTLKIHGLVSTYEQALAQLPPSQYPHRLICFIGSTLGNLSPKSCAAFLKQIRQALQPGDFFLLGVDLQKPIATLEAAYNDAQGVTAAFNLNMLRHLNRKFDGSFDLDCFEHSARYNAEENQIEMHLRSLVDQKVTLNSLDLTVEFAAGETIRSEISRKFTADGIAQSLEAQGLTPLNIWSDPKRWFAVALARA
ncbi:MAG: L-histidine N(alpha)-methyltransferase [Elainellaceae cyanobacterium]